MTISVEPINVECPRPVHRPVMTQQWNNLTYVHWRYDARVVQRLLPPGFTVDTYDGTAWVGLIPFEMKDIAFPVSSRISVKTGRFGTFPETNVRTYIIDAKGRRGVWFFSLDINRIAPTAIARIGYGLPYCLADMTVLTEHQPTQHESGNRRVRYTATRRWPRGKPAPTSSVEIRTGAQLHVESGSLDAFTSARWALGSRFLRTNLWAEVDHPTWDLYNAELLECDDTIVAAAGLPTPTGEPVVRWSPGVSVRVARPQLLR